LDPEFTAKVLGAALKGRSQSVKATLLQQSVVAGLGNIYVCEALHRSHIDPRRAAGALAPREIRRLTLQIGAVLREAITAGGSTLRDYRSATGELGYFQHAFTAYGREDQPCLQPACKGVILRIVQGGRSTFFCERCQR
jgi:formamidopyrimidine-DNA glycosylase